MTREQEIENEYFDWMYGLVYDKRHDDRNSYRKLFSALHSRSFYFILSMDENREIDGIGLRRQFAWAKGYDETIIMGILNQECTVLEMILSLALRIETEIMGKTDRWFWEMMNNMGLNRMNDKLFDKVFVEKTINKLLDREYEYDGKGGLFVVKNPSEDLRNVEIWWQMQWYLNDRAEKFELI